MRTAKTLIGLGGCPGWSESSLGAPSLCWFCHVAAHIVLYHQKPCFLKDYSDCTTKLTETVIVSMLKFLLDNIFVVFDGQIFQQTIGIPMGINCAPRLADPFLFSYGAEFIQGLLTSDKKKLAQCSNFTYRYTDNVLSLSNSKFSDYLLHLHKWTWN